MAAGRPDSSTRSSTAVQCEFLEDYAKPFSLLGDRRPARSAAEDHDEFRAVFAGEVGRRTRRGGADHAQSAAVAERQVLRLHRGSQARTARGRADRTGAGQVRRRLDPGHRGRHEPVDVPVRRRHRDHDQAGQLRDARHRREPRVRSSCCARTAARIPAFLEETLRTESPVKSHFRMARTSTTIGETEIPAGTTVMVLPGACNRDARKFDDPDTIPARPPQRPRADRVHPRRALLPRGTAGPVGGPDLVQPDPRPDDGHPDLRGAPRPGRRPSATPMSRRSSCADSPNCTWSSRRSRNRVRVATLFT